MDEENTPVEDSTTETPAIEPLNEEPSSEKPAENTVMAQTAPKELQNSLIKQVKRIASPIPGKLSELSSFIAECKRVLRVTKKPDRQEFSTIVKISAIGMGVIGLVGFLIHFIKELFF